jgi:hypothetical protein
MNISRANTTWSAILEKVRFQVDIKCKFSRNQVVRVRQLGSRDPGQMVIAVLFGSSGLA